MRTPEPTFLCTYQLLLHLLLLTQLQVSRDLQGEEGQEDAAVRPRERKADLTLPDLSCSLDWERWLSVKGEEQQDFVPVSQSPWKGLLSVWAPCPGHSPQDATKSPTGCQAPALLTIIASSTVRCGRSMSSCMM